MGPFDQLFILSPRGDSIIYKDYRGGQQGKDLPLLFFTYVMGLKEESSLPPLVLLDGVNFIFLKTKFCFFFFFFFFFFSFLFFSFLFFSFLFFSFLFFSFHPFFFSFLFLFFSF